MKNFIVKTLLTILFATVISFACNAQTNVSGGIFSNSTWISANSPYVVTSNVVVFPGVILTIQPGVTVKFENGTHLEIRQSKLIALGTNAAPIIFTSDSVSPALGVWDKIYLNSAISVRFDFCHVLYPQHGLTGYSDTIIVNHSLFLFNNTAIDAGSNVYYKVNRTTFRSNNTGIDWNSGGVLNVDSSIFIKNQTGFSSTSKSNIRNCVLDSNYAYGIIKESGDNDTVRGNEINYNAIGYSTGGGGGGNLTFIHNNVIDGNGIGIDLPPSTFPQVVIEQNCICNNSVYNLRNHTASNFDLSNNCWCSPDSITIESTIFDAHDDVNYGLIIITPFDTSQCNLTGIHSNEINSFSFNIFPNPSSADITIQTDKFFRDATVTVCNSLGQTVKQLENISGKEIILHRENLPCGVYFIRITQGNMNLSTRKLILTDN